MPTDTLFDLLRIGERSAARHKRRVMDALKDGAKDLLVSEDVVTSAGGKRVRVKVRLLELPTFRYDYHDFQMIGLGDAQPGDVIEDENPTDAEGEGEGAGKGGGGTSYEVEMSTDELIDLLMEAWELPNLEAKKKNEIVTEDYAFTDISKKGPASRIHKKKTIKNAIKRAAATGGEILIHNDDLRFRAPKVKHSYSSNAAIVLLRDRSGSMGPFEMKVSRMTAVWLVQFLRRRYDTVAIRFVLHDHAVNEVDEHTFYHVRSGGGTQIASALRFCQGILKQYPEAEYSRYLVQFSDGDDWEVDESVREITTMLPGLAAYFYVETNGWSRKQNSTFWMAQNPLEENDNFIRYAISEESDVPDALREFLQRNP